MKIALTGVLFDVDASLRAVGVPPNPRAPLRWPAGNDVTIDLLVIYASTGNPVDLTQAGTVVEFKVRSQPTPLDVPKLIDIVGVLPSPVVAGHMNIIIPHASQFPLIPRRMVGRLFYDVWYTLGTNRDAVVPTSPLLIEPPVSDIPTV